MQEVTGAKDPIEALIYAKEQLKMRDRRARTRSSRVLELVDLLDFVEDFRHKTKSEVMLELMKMSSRVNEEDEEIKNLKKQYIKKQLELGIKGIDEVSDLINSILPSTMMMLKSMVAPTKEKPKIKITFKDGSVVEK
ncbi:MAG: hypothetical protein QW599_05510 [Nitrososphaerota archaeon]